MSLKHVSLNIIDTIISSIIYSLGKYTTTCRFIEWDVVMTIEQPLLISKFFNSANLFFLLWRHEIVFTIRINNLSFGFIFHWIRSGINLFRLHIVILEILNCSWFCKIWSLRLRMLHLHIFTQNVVRVVVWLSIGHWCWMNTTLMNQSSPMIICWVKT